MAIVRSHKEGFVYRGKANRIQWFRFLKTNGNDVEDLTGYAGAVAFWYPGGPVYKTAACRVDATGGRLGYVPDGSEFPTLGIVLFQATAFLVDAVPGTNRAFFLVSHDIIRRRVVEVP